MLKDLSQIFKSREFPNRWQKEYLHLLTRFEVAIQLDHESILIPSFLPEEPPTLPVTMYPDEVVCLVIRAVCPVTRIACPVNRTACILMKWYVLYLGLLVL